MRLTKEQKKAQRRANVANYEADQRKYGPLQYQYRQLDQAAKEVFDPRDAMLEQLRLNDEVDYFDQRANAAVQRGDTEMAKMYTQLADDSAEGAEPHHIRVNEVRSAQAAAAKQQARNSVKASEIYGENHPENSWVADTATMRAEAITSGRGYDPTGQVFSQVMGGGFTTGMTRQVGEARERLHQYGCEIRDNVLAETEFGQSAMRYHRSQYRFRGYTEAIDRINDRIRRDIDMLVERRDGVTTIGADMSGFVPPLYFTKQFGLYRTFAAPLLSAASKTPLPAQGFEVLVPVLNAPLGIAAQPEAWGNWTSSTAYAVGSSTLQLVNGVPLLFEVTTAGTSGTSVPNWSSASTVGNTVTDGGVTWTNTARPTVGATGSGAASAPGGVANFFAPVNTYFGSATVSQAMLDRGIYGYQFDQVLAAQAAREIGTAQDSDLLSAILNNANVQSVVGTGSTLYKTGDFLTDLASAAEKVVVEGTNLQPTFIGAKSAVIRGFLKQVDSTGAPIFPFNPAAEVSPDGATEGYAGYNIAGARLNYEEQLAAYEDGSAIVLVGAPEQGLLVFESAPVVNTYPQWNGGSMQAFVQIYEYNAYAVRYGTAFCEITNASTYGS